MPRLHRTITVDKPVEEVFRLISDFTTVARWDPGIAAAEQVTGEGAGVGAEYRIEAVFNGRTIPMTYRTTVFEPPHRVVIEGDGANIAAVDEIRFEPSGESATEVAYTADFRLKGLFKAVQPFMKGAFDDLGDRAMDGMAEFLS